MMLGAAAFVAGNPAWSTQLADAAELAVAAGRAPLELEIRSWLAWSLACNGQAADADVHLARCAQLGASDSIHAHQCATATQSPPRGAADPRESTQFGAILPGSADPFMSFASALRCIYTGDATGLDQVWDDDDRSGRMATSMRSIQAALRILLIDDDPCVRPRDRARSEEPWLGRPVFPVVWLAATLALAAGHTATARSFADAARPSPHRRAGARSASPCSGPSWRWTMATSPSAERAAVDGLAVAVRQDLRPWICDLVEQIAFIDVAAGRAERASCSLGPRPRREATGYPVSAGTSPGALERRRRTARRETSVGGSRPPTSTAWPSGSCARRGLRARARTGWDALTPTELIVIGHVQRRVDQRAGRQPACSSPPRP